MKITKVIKRGQTRWKLELTKRENGTRCRRFFRTRGAAERVGKEHHQAARSYGVPVAQMLASLSIHQQTEVVWAFDQFKRLGYTPREAVVALKGTRQAPPSAPLGKAVADYLAAKETRGLRPRSFRKLDTTLTMFKEVVGENRPLREITEAHLNEFLTRNGWAAPTRKTYLGDVRTFLRWCQKRRLIPDNPADLIETPMLDNEPPGILRLGQLRALLDACQRERPSLLAWLALCAFAGLRPEEALRLTWADVRADNIHVEAAKAKTRRRRLIPISPQLRAWLDAAKPAGAELPPVNWQANFERVRRAASVLADWPHNALRHSFASYHYANGGNENDTARILGHAPQMLFQHYRELVTGEEAAKFFALRPDADAIAAGVTKEESDRLAAMEAQRAALRRGRVKRTTQALVPLPSNVISLSPAMADALP